MKLSNDTKEVLKNYASINANLLVTAGNKIATMSQMKNIVSTATVPDTFDSDFAIYDLNEFLSALSLFNDPELTFGEQNVRIAQGAQDLTYFYSDPSVVTTPKTEITMPSVDAEFTLTKDTFNQVLKAASVLGAPDMVLDIGTDSIMDLRVSDRKNDTSNSFSIEVGAESPAYPDVPSSKSILEPASEPPSVESKRTLSPALDDEPSVPSSNKSPPVVPSISVPQFVPPEL